MAQKLKFSQFGSEDGQLVIYFHGAPGAPEEEAIFDVYGKANGLRFVCFDRFSVDASVFGEAYYQLLAKEISMLAGAQKVNVIGFSIGAFVALQTCRYLDKNVKNLHLVSAAAPLEAGDFLDEMAGKQVFRLAQKFPSLFVLLSYWQSLLAWLFPDALFNLLFANTAGKDIALAAQPEFRAVIIKTLKSCFVGKVQGYTRDVKAYIQPWKATLADISINTYIWHGEADNWSPKAMASYLSSAISTCLHIEILEGLSHYSCLHESAPKICKLIVTR